MLRFLPVALALVGAALPAAADEFTDTLESALSAYRDGDVDGARQDLEYGTKLLTAMKAETLAKFLPQPLAGWTREDAGDAEAGGMMAMFGGGTTASATYRKGTEEMTITLVAGSPMVSGMAAMIGGLASMGGGKPVRIQRTEFGMNEGELQGVVDDKVLVTVSGNATIEDKTAHLEAMDFKALADF
jgi:hypothetical protein